MLLKCISYMYFIFCFFVVDFLGQNLLNMFKPQWNIIIIDNWEKEETKFVNDYWDKYDIEQTYIDNNQCLNLPAKIIIMYWIFILWGGCVFYFSRQVTKSAENILASEMTFDWLFTIHNTRQTNRVIEFDFSVSILLSRSERS